MSDEELAELITNMCEFERHGEPYKSIYNLDTDNEEEIHDSYGDLLIAQKADMQKQIVPVKLCGMKKHCLSK